MNASNTATDLDTEIDTNKSMTPAEIAAVKMAVGSVVSTELPEGVSKKQFTFHEAFGLTGPAAAETITGYTGYGDLVPKINPNYRFQPAILRMLTFWYKADPNTIGAAKNVALWGHYGAGKTEAFLQFAARLGIPVFEDTGDSARGAQDFIGMFVPGPNGLFFLEAPLIQALKTPGAIYLLNEVDKCSPATLVELHSLLDGWRITNQLDGKVFRASEGFRFGVTANTNGSGDHRGIYPGTRPLNTATQSRFIWIPCNYLPEQDEINLVQAHGIEDRMTASEMVSFARKTRTMFLHKEISSMMSTRQLLTWVSLVNELHGSPAIGGNMGLLEICYIATLKPEHRAKVAALYHDVIGPDYVTPFDDFYSLD